MNTKEDIKQIVKEKYSQIAKKSNSANCCDTSNSCCAINYSMVGESYNHLESYNPDADLNLGCGLPTEFANIKQEDTVVDLGSGAGNDCFVARSQVGEKGKIIGIDFSETMIEKANQNTLKLGYENIAFLLGDIENIPIEKNIADVVISNCVLNLVPDKTRAFAEIFRILKPKGHFSISDITIQGSFPEDLKKNAALYVGCIAGAIATDEYLQIIKQAGFENITIQKKREIILPDEMINQYFSLEEKSLFKNSNAGIFSITVYGEKP